jgi:hypothetical protein
VTLASARGRASVRVIHGTSTSQAMHRSRTIRHALEDMIDAGTLTPPVTASRPGEAETLLALDLFKSADPRRITMLDVS